MYPQLLSYKKNFKFIERFCTKAQISNFVKILPMGTELLRANRGTDGQRDRERETERERQRGGERE
jgi:hypothetical protein